MRRTTKTPQKEKRLGEYTLKPTTGFIQDRKEYENSTFWGRGYGLRRSFVQILKEEEGKWLVTRYKNKGYYEDAEKLPDKRFRKGSRAYTFAKSYMGEPPVRVQEKQATAYLKKLIKGKIY
jgi:hypothetical protein